MPQIAVRLYRLLHRVRREYTKAQIPLVGIVGFPDPPALNPRSQLVSAFRGAPLVDAANAAKQDSDGFRALRHAQQQLQILRESEEETREALRCWFLLCESWAQRLTGSRALSGTGTYADGTAASAAAGPQLGGGHGLVYCSGSGSAAGATRGDADSGVALALQLQQLSAAIEEGALLVERLYDANHISLEEFDTDVDAEGEAVAKAEPEAVVAATVGGAQSPIPGTESAGDEVLPAPLLVPSVTAARRQLDELAAEVAAANPGLFPGPVAAAAQSAGGGGGSGRPSTSAAVSFQTRIATVKAADATLLRQQLEAISQVLFHQYKFRHEPVEWVYDGLAPVLLPQVLHRRRGIPLSLAVLYCSVARRLGVAAVPVKAAAGGAPGVSEGPATLHSLPPEVTARQAGRTVALAPPMDAWLVAAAAPPPRPPPPPPSVPGTAAAASEPTCASRDSASCGAGGAAVAGSIPTTAEVPARGHTVECSSPSGSSSGAQAGPGPGPGAGTLFVDVDRRGRVMEPKEVQDRYAQLPAVPLIELLVANPVELWAELARVMVTAHGRRGESDIVAHWLVQVLALDHRAPEWGVMPVQ